MCLQLHQPVSSVMSHPTHTEDHFRTLCVYLLASWLLIMMQLYALHFRIEERVLIAPKDPSRK